MVDKHCIGGIPGNRTSMLVVPIVTAHGMLCPKTSSRAITSPSASSGRPVQFKEPGVADSLAMRPCIHVSPTSTMASRAA